jgi:hypothetical protein
MNPQSISDSCLERNFNYSGKKKICVDHLEYIEFLFASMQNMGRESVVLHFLSFRFACTYEIFFCDGMRAGCSHAFFKRLRISLIY